jgi:predicted RNA-binding Zn-ribbon protein involved in translation (DUF1610 family)
MKMYSANGRKTSANKEVSSSGKDAANLVCPNCKLKVQAKVEFGEDNICSSCGEKLEKILGL